jgi:hypothetical protein
VDLPGGNWFWLVARGGGGDASWFHENLGNNMATSIKSHYLIGTPNFLAAASMISFS